MVNVFILGYHNKGTNKTLIRRYSNHSYVYKEW